ncbi:MAG TPA: DNA helicase [Candidatus Hungatella pullicola]|nr:DNA helicase [Candidatus Hungatella pullicola]
MSDKGSTQEFFNQIKTIVENYMRSRKPAAIFLGTYTGNAVMIETLPIPMSMISGNMKSRLVAGDKVRLLRNDRGGEYYILEIVGKPDQTTGG